MRLGKKKRLPEDFPVEYSKGFVRFLNCKIDLRERVLIPRPETEFWVRRAIKELSSFSTSKGAKLLYVLDMFSGSGCIGIAILKACPELCQRVDFVDIDEKAIEQIKINLKLNGISMGRYKIYQSNLFEKFTPHRTCSGAGLKDKGSKKIISSSSSFLLRKNSIYDYIFANPPYVAKERLGEVQSSVLKYEPERALLAGKGGLFYIRGFLKEVKNFLKPDGVIFLEFDPHQKNNIVEILKQEGFKKSQFFKDQFGKYRFVKVNV